MSQRNAFSYIHSLGVGEGLKALNGPTSLPFTVDVLLKLINVPQDVYRAFGDLHTLTPGNHDADEAYRLLGRSVFPKASVGEGQPFDVAGEKATADLLGGYRRAGNLVIFLSQNDEVLYGIRPRSLRNRWDVGGPFQVSAVESSNFKTIVTQEISRSEPTSRVLPISADGRFHGIVFPG